jgi:hypothetical protein
MRLFYLIISLFLSQATLSQSTGPVKTIIIACQSGELYIDGTLVATIEADDARKEILSPGEHYVQLKTAVGRINLTIKVDTNRNEIIRLGCKEALVSESSIKLVEKKLYLTGLLAPAADDNLIGLDGEDQLLVTCSVLDKKGTVNIIISNLYTGQEIFRRQSFDEIQNERVRIPSKGIYKVQFSTSAIVGKNVQFALHRIAGPNSQSDFKTTVSLKADTAFHEVLSTNARVYSQTNSRPNKTAVRINLPANTTYWAYWIGVGQKDKAEMKNLCDRLSSAGGLISANPVVLLGLKILPNLPIMNSTETVTYKYMSSQNSAAFVGGLGYQYYSFKFGDNVSSDYAVVSDVPQDLVIAMENKNIATGFDVDIKVVAFVVTQKWVMDN